MNKKYLLIKLPLYWFFRTFSKPVMLPFNYTFSVSFKCNSRCKTCNIWKLYKNTKGKELDSDEWKMIIKKLGNAPFWITLSGGEPFLRKDITEIVETINKYNKPEIINIPTNGILKNTPDKIEEILKILRNSNTTLVVNYSIDDVGELHDEIRGVKGNWEMVLNSYLRTKELKNKYNNLVVGIHTVISRWNVNKLPEIATYLINNLKPDQYITEIAEERFEMENFENKPTPNPKDYEKAINFLINEIKKNLKENKWRGLSKITESFRIEYYKYVKDLYLGKSNGMKSYAGFATCQISPIGDVWECAVYASKMGNLRDFNYNFKKLWNSEQAWEVRKRVKKEHKCPLANEAYANMLLNPLIALKVLKRVVMM